MAIVVIGGGAIGLLVAGKLAQASHCVGLLAREHTVQALHYSPLRITHKQCTTFAGYIDAATEPSALPVDNQHPHLAIVCVKGYDTPSVLPTLEALQPAHILTLQNGIGNEEFLAHHFGAEHVFAGIITYSVEPIAPECVTITKRGGIGIASMQHTPTTDHATTLRIAHFDVHEYADYRALKWSKALLNILGNATSAILDMPVEAVYANPRLVDLERRAFLEGLRVMRHMGIEPVNLPRYPAATLATLMHRLPLMVLHPLLQRAIAGGRGGKAPSLQRDLHQGRTHSEVDTLNGAIAQAARHTNIPAPVNSTLWYALNGIASGALPWDFFRHKPKRLLDICGM